MSKKHLEQFTPHTEQPAEKLKEVTEAEVRGLSEADVRHVIAEYEPQYIAGKKRCAEVDEYLNGKSIVELVENENSPRTFNIRTEVLEFLLRHFEAGFSPLLALYYDKNLKKSLDAMPMEDALRYVPALMEALQKGDKSALETYMASVFEMAFAKSDRKKTQLQYFADEVERLKKSRQKVLGMEQALQQWGVGHSFSNKDSILNVTPKPRNILMLRTAPPSSILETEEGWPHIVKLKILNNELKRRQLMHHLYDIPLSNNEDKIIRCSSYTGRKSGTLYGVGISINPTNIYAAFPVDIASEHVSAYAAEHQMIPQLINWEGIAKCSDARLCSRINEYFWYSELWASGYADSVVVRPFDSLVTRSISLGHPADTGRVLAAVALARQKKLPVKILA